MKNFVCEQKELLFDAIKEGGVGGGVEENQGRDSYGGIKMI